METQCCPRKVQDSDSQDTFPSRLQVKYKEDLEWMKGIGCFVWDTPEMVQADINKTLYSGVSHLRNNKDILIGQ